MIALMSPPYHRPVLVNEVLDALAVIPGGRYIDATVGEGGHASAILEASAPTGLLLGIDADTTALQQAQEKLQPFAPSSLLVQGNYSQIWLIAQEHGFYPVQGILFDLGLSSLQLEGEERGFTFLRNQPLDMRFDPRQPITAEEIINTYPQEKLQEILRTYGEEPAARAITREIVRSRPIYSTSELVEIVQRASPRRPHHIHPATRTFQALRIAVNQELHHLGVALADATTLLAPGGRLVVISYHSLEDRLVKNFMRRESTDCLCPPRIPQCVCGHRAVLRLVTRKVITPSEKETWENPRSRSARMRVAELL